MTMSGRRPTGKAKKIGSAFLEGLSAVGQAMNDGPLAARILEIDAEIEVLKHERDACIDKMYEPGNLEHSDVYDPNWQEPAENSTWVHDHAAPVGRLTECKGRTTTSRYHEAHPGCPYIETVHNKHTFTLRD